MTEGKVLTAAHAQGLGSLAKVANALVAKRPELFSGITPRSLGAKLSDLNRGNATWWRTRTEQVETLEVLLGLDAKELVVAEEARRRGLWVFNEFPELPALNLLTERPPTIADPVLAPNENDSRDELFTWMRIGTGSEHKQLPVSRLEQGVRWLTIPKCTGLSLLLAQFQARSRIEVFEGRTLHELISRVHPLRPAVLAPTEAPSPSDLAALAQLDPDQPVLVISSHPLPQRPSDAPKRTDLPSWEWLSATPAERAKARFAGEDSRIARGIWESNRMVGFVLQLKPDWRSLLLLWIEERLSRHADSLFSANGLAQWLDAFDPDEVLFATPAAVMSLARTCHDVGERKLPKPDHPEAGMNLIKQLSGADSRYRSLLGRLVARQWLDASAGIQQGRAWDEWLKPRQQASGSSAPKVASARNAKASKHSNETKDALQLTSVDLDAAAKANLLTPNRDGNYEIRSQAEAMLALRDMLRDWLHSGDIGRWATVVVGDETRQQLVDAMLATLDNAPLIAMCPQLLKLPTWSLASLGASETLFITIGLRMATGTMGYRPEFGELLKQTLARCIRDDTFISLPLSRSLGTDKRRIEWIHASWGWSLVAPRPEWVPNSMAECFPGWAREEVDWLAALPLPFDEYASLHGDHARKLVAVANTAAKVVQRIGKLNEDSSASPELQAVVALLHAAHNHGEIDPAWWQVAAAKRWSRDVLSMSFADLAPRIRQRLAASMVEACLLMLKKSLSVVALVHSDIWVHLLGTVDAGELCLELSTRARAFIACNIEIFPPSLRQTIFEALDPLDLPLSFDWEALFRATGNSGEVWLDRSLIKGHLHRWGIATAMWAQHPQTCLAVASDPNSPHRGLLRDCCAPEWTAVLAATLAKGELSGDDQNDIARWASNRIASFGHRAQPFVDLLSLVTPGPPGAA